MGHSNIIFSVIICTYNRADFIRDCISSVLKQDFPLSDYEIIVVDNGSTDGTSEIVKQFLSTQEVSVRYVRENRQGLSFARNRGIAESRGELAAFIDDDAIADENWLKELHKVYLSTPSAGGIGGKILLNWMAQRPLWLHDDLLPFLGYFDPSPEVGKMAWPEYIHGGNMSFKRSLLTKNGSFNVSLGYMGKKLVGNEELELCERLERNGWQIMYTPYAIVYHAVPDSKLTIPFFRRRGYYQGVAKVITENIYSPSSRFKLFGKAILNSAFVLSCLPLLLLSSFTKGKIPFLSVFEVHIFFRIGMVRQFVEISLGRAKTQ